MVLVVKGSFHFNSNAIKASEESKDLGYQYFINPFKAYVDYTETIEELSGLLKVTLIIIMVTLPIIYFKLLLMEYTKVNH